MTFRFYFCLVVLLSFRWATPGADVSVRVPGIAINHSPKSSGLYIGSPSLTVLPTGSYLASHDFFGSKSDEWECPTVAVFRSPDRGEIWQEVARLKCLFWANLFTHQNAAFIMGVDKHHGRIVIRRSTDGGMSWTTPDDEACGLLASTGQYHTAPMPMVHHNGRLWRAFEDAMGGTEWGKRYRAGMLSIALEADPLAAKNWVFSNFLPRNPEWLNGDFGAWLEGNAVLTKDGKIVNVLRVQTRGYPEKAAIVRFSENGKEATFDPTADFIDFPGGAKKFVIRFDPKTDRYWALATPVLPEHQKAGAPGSVRNALALLRSSDLRHWEIRSILLHHPDTKTHGFQYPDWHFDGEDIIAVVRTAYDDLEGGAHNNHDANYMTFHRWRNFRELSMNMNPK